MSMHSINAQSDKISFAGPHDRGAGSSNSDRASIHFFFSDLYPSGRHRQLHTGIIKPEFSDAGCIAVVSVLQCVPCP